MMNRVAIAAENLVSAARRLTVSTFQFLSPPPLPALVAVGEATLAMPARPLAASIPPDSEGAAAREDVDEDIAAGVLAEAQRLLGITGPRYGIVVGGHAYRLLDLPVEQPAAAAALFADMLLMARSWLGRNPEAAQEMSEYGIPYEDGIKALPFVVQSCIFVGLAFEIYAQKHGAKPRPTDDLAADDSDAES